MTFSCKKCGKHLGYDTFYEHDSAGNVPELPLVVKKEPRCTNCGYLFLDPFRKCRRLLKLAERKRLNEERYSNQV